MKKNYVTRPNCALNRRTILSLYVPGFRKVIFKHVPKCQWIRFTKIPWISRTNNCNVNLVSPVFVSPNPQQASIANCSAFRNCKWNPQNVSGIRNFEWNPQAVSGFRILFIIELACEQLKVRAWFLICSNEKFRSKDLTILNGIH